METLSGKKIILGVSGSIAAYKTAHLTRLLVKAGAEVQVLMTPSATQFITPLTLATLSRRPVFHEVSQGDSWHNHVELGLWADAMVIAPATATTLARMANGLCDTMLQAVYLSARCPVFFAPAMDLDMWRHPATQANVQRLQGWGQQLIPVAHGELASGLVGDGRMAEPETIVELLRTFFQQKQDLAGRKILITAGPTYEPLDPVRFIGNRSSGKMGVALAHAAARRGAQVTLLLGPSGVAVDTSLVQLVRVESAREMYAAALERFPAMDVAILAAAVADYRPAVIAGQKIKKQGETMTVDLVKNPDIAADLGRQKQPHQWIVGFALETNDEEANAREKMTRKNFDMIVLNSLRDPGAGFHLDTNKVSILTRKGNKRQDFELKSKTAVAEDILQELTLLLGEM